MSSKSKTSNSDATKHGGGFVSRLLHKHSDDKDNEKLAPKVSTATPPAPGSNQAPTKAKEPAAKRETTPKPEVHPDPPTLQQPNSASSRKGRRAAAEKRLEDAAKALSKSMTKGPAAVPDSIGLQQLSNIKDVEGTAKQLESAIDGIIDARSIKANADSRRVWKDCIKNWYKAIYPYAKFGLEQVKVRSLLF